MNYAKSNTRQNGGSDYGNYDYDYSSQYQNMYQNQNRNFQNQNRRGLYQQQPRQQYQQSQKLIGGQSSGVQGGYTGATSGYGGASGYNGASGYGGVSGNGYGSYGYGSTGSQAQSKQAYGAYSGGYNDCPGIPLALLLITTLGILTMGVLFYLKVVAAGRRKRDTSHSWTLEDLVLIFQNGRWCSPVSGWSG